MQKEEEDEDENEKEADADAQVDEEAKEEEKEQLGVGVKVEAANCEQPSEVGRTRDKKACVVMFYFKWCFYCSFCSSVWLTGQEHFLSLQ